MDKIATENLFLLEFLVDSVNLDPDTADNKTCQPPGETCVSFQFLDNAPLDVCEQDFNPQRDYKRSGTGGNEDVKSGKSCLFSLSPDQALESTKQFDIFVTIFKKMQPGWLPEKVDLGEALISICNLFNELISSVETSNGTSPTAKTLKDVFDITNAAGQVIGKIGVYIRMSCFGKLIVTQFQMNLNDKSVLFKDKDGKSLYRYKKAGKSKKNGCNPRVPQKSNQPYQPQPPPCSCSSQRQQQQQQPNPAVSTAGLSSNNPMCPFPPCLMDDSMGLQEAYGQWPCMDCDGNMDARCYSSSNNKGGYGGAAGVMPTPQPPATSMMMMTPCIECGNIPYAPCMPQQPPPQVVGGYYGQPQPNNTPCDQCSTIADPPCASAPPPPPDNGNYQEIGASMGGNSLTIRVHKDKNNVEQMDPNCAAMMTTTDEVASEGCMCIPGKPGKKRKQPVQILNMRPGIQQGNENVPFSFKMGGGTSAGGDNGGGGNNNVIVNPPVATSPDGTKFTEFSDPNKEVFILRIGKKSEGVDKKQNLELELCTPKGPELKPIPKLETRDTQYDPLDAGPEDGKADKPKKGKGGKKGGKKDKKKKK